MEEKRNHFAFSALRQTLLTTATKKRLLRLIWGRQSNVMRYVDWIWKTVSRISTKVQYSGRHEMTASEIGAL
jgi:hypothetical protein